ncbi:methionine--tRNA ligase [bacterium]|nr:methionine--tRNA ligase [bacterium]
MTTNIFLGVAWPYANGPLHLGHVAGCYLPADEFARYHRMKGNHVLMVSGSDGHGTPITVRAQKEGVTPNEVAQRYHEEIVQAFKGLNIKFDLFTTTRTDNHRKVVQELFLDLYKKGHIVLQSQELLYCPEEKHFLPDRYVEGVCPHCGAEKARGDQCDACGRTYDAKELKNPYCKTCGATPIIKSTEHFFFRWQDFGQDVISWLSDKTYWRPNVMNFTHNYLENGLRESAITRDMEWGIPVPIEGYEDKRIYVWWEAVVGYLSASIEWASKQSDPECWRDWWTDKNARCYYFIGKDNIPFHAIRWPAVLLGDGRFNLPYDIPANEFLNLEGRKFSTSENWALWANDILERYDADAVRYMLTAIAPESSDSDFTWAEFVRRNNDELVGWWGNLVNRCLTFFSKHFEGTIPAIEETAEDQELLSQAKEAFDKVGAMMEKCQIKGALAEAMEYVRIGNRYFDSQAPWKQIKIDRQRTAAIMATMVRFIASMNVILTPFIPGSCAKLHEILALPGAAEASTWSMPSLEIGHKINTPQPLFKKLDTSVAEEEKARLG